MTNIGNMYGPNFTFLGIPRCDLDKPENYKGADVIIVGAPIDSGTSHRSGAKMGPCLLYTSPSPRDRQKSRMPSSA